MRTQRQFGWLFWLSALTWFMLLFLGLVSGAFAVFLEPRALFHSLLNLGHGDVALHNLGVFAIGFTLLALFLACGIYCVRVILRST